VYRGLPGPARDVGAESAPTALHPRHKCPAVCFPANDLARTTSARPAPASPIPSVGRPKSSGDVTSDRHCLQDIVCIALPNLALRGQGAGCAGTTGRSAGGPSGPSSPGPDVDETRASFRSASRRRLDRGKDDDLAVTEAKRRRSTSASQADARFARVSDGHVVHLGPALAEPNPSHALPTTSRKSGQNRVIRGNSREGVTREDAQVRLKIQQRPRQDSNLRTRLRRILDGRGASPGHGA
jgi:hypothetical protein